MKKFSLCLLFPFLLFSCRNTKKNLVPIYHIKNINQNVDNRNYHLLYEADGDILNTMLKKKASFPLAVYSKTCSDTCSTFLYTIYSIVNEQNLFLPYMTSENYSTIHSDVLPGVKGNALIFFYEGKPYRQFDFQDTGSDQDVFSLVEKYTYDTKRYLHAAIVCNLDKDVPTYTFTEETETSFLTFDSDDKSRTLYLSLSLTTDFGAEFQTYQNEAYQAIYPFMGVSSLTPSFFKRTGIEKEDLENRSSYLH